jgi:hypothetical protein
MSSVVISGDTSGAITVSAPLVAGTNTLTLQAATATSAVNKLETAVASTSGVSIDYTSIPSWVKKITVMFNAVSTNATSLFLIQIGSGSVTTSGYSSGSIYSGTLVTSTAGFLVDPTRVAASLISGNVVITLLGSNTYTSTGAVFLPATYVATSAGVSPALSGALDRVRITTVSGTDVFDAGSVNLLLEG